MTSEYLIGNLKLGDATNHVSITSLVTGIKSVQFPDFGGTIALIEKAQTWSLTQTFSEQLLGKNGTKTSPSYSFSSDADTGFFWKSSGSVGFSANDTEIGSWSSAGAFTFGPTGYTGTHNFRGLTANTGYGKFGNTACNDGGKPTFISGVERSLVADDAYDTKMYVDAGLVLIRESSSTGHTALFFMAAATTVLLSDPGSIFSATDLDTKACLLYDTGSNGGAGSGYTLRNRLGGDRKFSYHLMSITNALA